LFDYYRSYNPPANVGRPPPYEEWLQRAIREDREAARLLPPEQPYYGPLLHEARARADRAYRDWKATIDNMWVDKYNALLVAACARQREAARQEAARTAHRLLHEQADRARQEAATRHQRSIDEETACRRRAVQARQTAAARVIFLWLRRRRLFARLARQTSRRRQHEAALARMQHEQDCCTRALQAAEHHRQAAAARAKAIADEAPAWHRQSEETRRQAALTEAKRHEVTLAAEEHHRAAISAEKQVASEFAMLMASLQELVEERRHHEAQAAKALALVEERCHHEAVLAAEADERRRYGAAARAVEPEALTPDEDCRHHKSVTRDSISTVITLADK